MPQTLYYVQLEDETFGPFALATARKMNLLPDVQVLSTATNEWREACDYPELIDSLDLSELGADEESEGAEAPIPQDPNYRIPPVNERSMFYIRRLGNPYGPYNLDALRSVTLTDDTDISFDGMQTWVKVRDIPGLQEALSATEEEEQDAMPMDMPAPTCAPEPEDNTEEISRILEDIQRLIPTKKSAFRRMFPSREAEREYLIGEYNDTFDTLMARVERLSDACQNAILNNRAIKMITGTVNDAAQQINSHYSGELERMNADKGKFIIASVQIGHTEHRLSAPLERARLTRLVFLDALGDRSLCVTYEAGAEAAAMDFANMVVGRLYESNPPRTVVTNVVDIEHMTGLDDTLKLLNRDLYKVTAREDDVRGEIAELQQRASGILRNLLVEKDATLGEYNSTHESKEANVLLVLKDFPRGFNLDTLDKLQKLANVGTKVGIYIVLLTRDELLESLDEREAEAFSVADFMARSNVFHFKANQNTLLGAFDHDDADEALETDVEYDTLTEAELKQIVKDVNAKCELREDVVIPITDYVPDTAEWWSGDSAKQIEVPFGVGNDMLVKTLKITQESGQNTAVVIGIPGSGKSVFLHSLICGAAIKYSPDELRMYLIDFSGVEFNTYALGKLPHARVIAPEAEREFGLSILNELVEEGSRRMELCREHHVSNIVDLKRVAPEVKVPRLLVVIDEFQKLFEVDNDNISKEANSKIHIIIQEFRKFGINLILATQKLPMSSFLPRDLIANRIVFKSAPGDFDTLITLENRHAMPRLRTGQCVYNSESGAAYANEVVQGFFTSKADLDRLLKMLRDYERGYAYEREPLKVFRSGDLPEFEHRRLAEGHREPAAMPTEVPIYFGESIAVSDVDVNVELTHENANNVLVIGGEAEIARNIAYNAMRSAALAHAEGACTVVALSGMRADNPLNERIIAFANDSKCDLTLVTSAAQTESILKELREEVEARRADEALEQRHVFVVCFDFQSIRALDKVGGGMMPKQSPAAKDMETIIKQGPNVGVFVIAQTDTTTALARVSTDAVSSFNFHAALQMPEKMSYALYQSNAANRLYVFNRPSSRFRGYVWDIARNVSIKFKPYK